MGKLASSMVAGPDEGLAEEVPPMEEPEETETDQDEIEEGAIPRYAHVILLLEKHAEDVMELVEEVGEECLEDVNMDIPPEDAEVLAEQLQKDLDPELADAMRKAFGENGISLEDAQSIAEHLVDEEFVDSGDEDLLAGWLFRIAQAVGGVLPVEEDEDADDEDLDDEDLPDDEDLEEDDIG